MAAAPFLTTSEYLRTPETLQPTELINGALRVAEAPSVRHQQAVGAFHLSLAPHVRARKLGYVLLSPLDVILDWNRALVLQPDLLFISRARWKVREERIAAAPDMVLEVLSPHPRIGRIEERIALLAQYGVREIWLLHHLTERFEILHVESGRVARRDGFDYTQPIDSGVLPEFRMTVGEILEE